MREKSNYQKGRECFTNVVQINEKSGDGWGNLAACCIHLGKEESAVTALEKAVRHREKSWKMWE